MSKLADLISAAKLNGRGIWLGGPASAESIDSLQAAMGIRLPDALRCFLAEIGAVGIDNVILSGICSGDPQALEAGNIYGDTLILREEFPDIPPEMWVLSRHADGAFCLDASRSNSHQQLAIVNWEPGSIHHDAPLTWDYDDFVSRWILSPESA